MKLKSILAVISAFTIVFGSVPTQPFADVIGNLSITANAAESTGSCGDNVTYILDSDGTLTISGSGEMSNYTGYGSPLYITQQLKK